MKCVVFVTMAPHYYDFAFKLTSNAKTSYLKIQAGKTFSYQGHVLVTLYV